MEFVKGNIVVLKINSHLTSTAPLTHIVRLREPGETKDVWRMVGLFNCLYLDHTDDGGYFCVQRYEIDEEFTCRRMTYGDKWITDDDEVFLKWKHSQPLNFISSFGAIITAPCICSLETPYPYENIRAKHWKIDKANQYYAFLRTHSSIKKIGTFF